MLEEVIKVEVLLEKNLYLDIPVQHVGRRRRIRSEASITFRTIANNGTSNWASDRTAMPM